MIKFTECLRTCISFVPWRRYLTSNDLLVFCQTSGLTDLLRRLQTLICGVAETTFAKSGLSQTTSIMLSISTLRPSFYSFLHGNFLCLWAGTRL